ncbi:MAG: hypothetical protein U9N59_03135 [Campylobacterota bacterium]|nr:hypothetical protein [Campylobacterota bacterium]
MNKIFFTGLLLINLMFSGCATLFGGGGQQNIYISGNTDKKMKATVKHSDGSGSQYLSIPGTVSINRKKQDVVIESADKEFDTYIVESEMNPYFVPNFLGSYFGFTSTTVDVASGAIWMYDEHVIVNEK